MKTIFGFILISLTTTVLAAKEPAPTPQLEVNWPQFLAQQDLLWQQAPSEWFDAPFLGNGFIGTMIYQDGPKSLRLDVGRGDVYDHRKTQIGMWLHRCRLPIGYFTLDTAGKIQSFTGRLDLWNAEFNGQVTTDKGVIRLRAFVHATRLAMIFDVDISAGERDCWFTWHPENAEASSRTSVIGSWNKMSPQQRAKAPRYVKAWAETPYVPHPPFQLGREGDIKFCYQPLRDGSMPSGETTTAWQDRAVQDGKRRLCVSIAHTYPQATSKADAIAAVRATQGADFDKLVSEHRNWWHAYYPASFLSIPDSYWERFYWIQMYKLASATRADGPCIDQMGPWYHITNWPCVWWNLNVQLTYWPMADANRLELAESLVGRLDRYHENLVANMPKSFGGECAGIGGVSGQDFQSDWSQHMLGNLPWAMHDYWRVLRRNVDDKRMREKFFPLLRQTMNPHLRLLSKEKDGRWHLAASWSPEYPGGMVPDTSYNLALLRWGCQTLIELCEQFKINDPLLPKWKDVLANLTDYPADKNGFMIGAGRPLAMAHRHYSHLLAIYPLYLVNVDQPGGRELITKSLEHWMSFKPTNGGGRSCYSWAGASSMASALGDGDLALQYLNGTKQPIPFQAPGQGVNQTTTMYRENSNPCMETPLAMAQSIHDMLIQSWGGTIRIFPACPSTWKNAAFRDLRAERAFLVSAIRNNGKTQWVRIKSLAGEPCRVWIDNKVQELKLAKGEEIVIRDGCAAQAK